MAWIGYILFWVGTGVADHGKLQVDPRYQEAGVFIIAVSLILMLVGSL